MTTLLVIVWGLLTTVLMLLLAIRPQHGHRSWFELRRVGDQQAIRRERLLQRVSAVRRLLIALLLVLVTFFATLLWLGWGILASLVVYVVAILGSGNGLVTRYMTKMYHTYESRILEYVEKVPLLSKFVDEQQFLPKDQKLESIEQLRHLVESQKTVLSGDQQTMMTDGMYWHTTQVEQIMTPRKRVMTIGQHEVLGPLVLDDLHRSGHRLFPVVGADSERVVGIIDTSSLMNITSEKASSTVSEVMSRNIITVKADDTLAVLLDAFRTKHQTMAIVVDANELLLGIVTLSDATRFLWKDNR